MKSRRTARKRALHAIFEADIRGVGMNEVLLGKREAGEEEPSTFCLELIDGVMENRDYLDGISAKYSENWELDRMPVVDRNVLRIGLYELLFREDIPAGATIDEAVRLAKELSTEMSGKFVNGILGRVERDLEAGKLSLPGQ